MSYSNDSVKESADYKGLKIEAIAESRFDDGDHLRFYFGGDMKAELRVKSGTGKVVKTANDIYHKDYVEGKYSILAQEWRKLQPVGIDDGMVDICNSLLEKIRANSNYPQKK